MLRGCTGRHQPVLLLPGIVAGVRSIPLIAVRGAAVAGLGSSARLELVLAVSVASVTLLYCRIGVARPSAGHYNSVAIARFLSTASRGGVPGLVFRRLLRRLLRRWRR